MEAVFKDIPIQKVSLLGGMYHQKRTANRKYLMSLENEHLLRNHYMEAGLWHCLGKPETGHWGWESPTGELRGHFLGHWLSAAAMQVAATGDIELKAKADHIVSELQRCQQENGGEWVGSIPEKYLERLATGQKIMNVPKYVVHKTLMGLFDMYRYADSEQALTILINFAKWFSRWTDRFSRQVMDDILDVEHGGILEVWVDLYAVTGQEEHLELVKKYTRSRLFDPLLRGEDLLTNKHANTTIPEVLGAARAYEVTGDPRWREIVEAYWRCAVVNRGTFCTGGQTSGEVWTLPWEFAARLGDRTQEHCSVYNMMRLADYLYRWTGDPVYADYWERNLLNGILAQGYCQDELIAYYLPLQAGAAKKWGSATDHFWCCHGTLVQANAIHGNHVYQEDSKGLIISQYIPTELKWEFQGTAICVKQQYSHLAPAAEFQKLTMYTDKAWRSKNIIVDLSISCAKPTEFVLKCRMPSWVKGEVILEINGEKVKVDATPNNFLHIERVWTNETVRLQLPKTLSSCPLPDDPDKVAFMDGPVVLVGLCEEERTLYGNLHNPESILAPDNEIDWPHWLAGCYRTIWQDKSIRFIPISEVCKEKYTVYFPVGSVKE